MAAMSLYENEAHLSWSRTELLEHLEGKTGVDYFRTLSELRQASAKELIESNMIMVPSIMGGGNAVTTFIIKWTERHGDDGVLSELTATLVTKVISGTDPHAEVIQPST